ncbi:Uu.00g078810.m01.CDS01 [Anthostomella pinea]|uniref:Uu.00g078810.m01.CDS01 n=1 Tax=Anthostomella pinea TaxID=933095 RepID=A0AAI8VKN4_9PEZI|nr:Uu.00g078810.m01.CDS01 [Anthostomella pinea]
MPKSSNAAAKEKYQAVIDDAGRGDFYCKHQTQPVLFPINQVLSEQQSQGRTNRYGTTRHPSSGDCLATNKVDHPVRRRSSAANDPPRMRDKLSEMFLNRPAF